MRHTQYTSRNTRQGRNLVPACPCLCPRRWVAGILLYPRLPPGWTPAQPQAGDCPQGELLRTYKLGSKQKNSARLRVIIGAKVRISIRKRAAKKICFLTIFLLTMFETMLKYPHICQQANINRQQAIDIAENRTFPYQQIHAKKHRS